MAFRATAFNDPRGVKLLSSNFVCAGIAHNGAGRRKDAEGDFARKIIGSGGTLQGLHVINTSGDLIVLEVTTAATTSSRTRGPAGGG